MRNQAGPIVVGIDASSGTSNALAWASNEAAERHAPMHLVYAYDPMEISGAEPRVAIAPYLEWGTAAPYAEEFVDAAVADLRDSSPEVKVTGAAVWGRAANVLCAESEKAQLVVLGSRRLGAVRSHLFGSVGQRVAAAAKCPTVIVRGSGTTSNSMIVGLAGDEADDVVLGLAFDEASVRGAVLTIVHAWEAPVWPSEALRPDVERSSREGAAAAVRETVTRWSGRYPDVVVATKIIEGHPAAVLTEQSSGCHLLVVGRTHRVPLNVLGRSVSQAVLHHANCPVAIVPVH